MIRFCDREVYCIEYCKLSHEYTENKADLLKYFVNGHQDDVVCVYDNSTKKFVGIITYQSLNRFLTVREAIRTEYLVWDENIWKNARAYCRRHPCSGTEYLIPVLDQDHQLILFAYEDLEANREIRMLRELMELPDALQFTDIYSEYKCVKIYEFNELAYFFAKYLESQNIAVQVEGAMWQGFFSGREYSAFDHECLNVYAEGTWKKKYSWKENLLKSVSVEFEYIDRIYEANIENGIIEDAKSDCLTLLEYLKNEKEIVICGAGREEQAAYDFLMKNGIDICCFMEDVEFSHRLFGKKIINDSDVRAIYQAPIFIDCHNQNSSWGMGNVDYFDYIGYKRNEQFILLRDYVEVVENNLLNIIKDIKVVLMGDVYLCARLYDYLIQKNILAVGYLRVFSEDTALCNLPEACVEETDEDTIFFLVVPYYFTYSTFSWKGEKEKRKLIEYLEKINIDNYTDYFSDMNSFVNIEKDVDTKYTRKWLTPKRIVLGSIEAYNGNEFFRGLVDAHPSIAIIHYSDLNNNLFWICVRLSIEEPGKILSSLWKMIKGDEKWIFNPSKFNEKMEQLLSYGDRFRSQELFVMIHIAYMYMCENANTEVEYDIKDKVIYWEPHHMIRAKMEELVKWLGAEKCPCDIINVVRNICMQNGSAIKDVQSKGVSAVYYRVLHYPDLDKKHYAHSDRLIVKFEDLKCNPQNILMKICSRWEIEWSDILLQTTRLGKEISYVDKVHTVKNFDLEPVYNMYENYFSEFDRFRLMLINAPWQRMYGYPFVEVTRFSRKELQEMFLYEFRFEYLEDELWRTNINNRIALQNDIKKSLQKTRMLELKEDCGL